MSEDLARRARVAERWVEVGVFDPTADGAASLLDVLVYLDSVGVDPDGLSNLDAGDLIGSINRRFVAPDPTIPAAEARAAVGFDERLFERLCRAGGYDPNGRFTELDVEAFQAFATARRLFSIDELLHFARVLSSSMGRVADATTSLFRIDIASGLDRAGASDVEYTRMNYESSLLIEGVYVATKAFLRHQLRPAVIRSDASRRAATQGAPASVRVAIGFVDIAGFTPMADAMAIDELDRFIVAFESSSYDVVDRHGGRVVKLIGDEVMFVATRPGEAFRIGHEIIAEFASAPVVPRGAVVFGDVLSRGGDYYGRLVNLAARLVDRAAPGTLVTDEGTVAASAGEGPHRFVSLGRHEIRGFQRRVEVSTVVPVD